MSPRGPLYLDNATVAEALRRLWEALGEPPGPDRGEAPPFLGPEEVIATTAALGRVTAGPVFARRSVPHYLASAMDGVAVLASDTFGASETTPISLRLGHNAFPVDTGDVLPAGCDAVVMIEDVQLDEETVTVDAATTPWQHVRPIGEDVVQSDMLLASGHRLRPADLGALLAAGVTEVAVRRRPRVAILPTGDEIVPPERELQPGEIPEFNSATLSGLIAEWGGDPSVRPITPDSRELLRQRVEAALADHDIVVINAGSSTGKDDHTAGIIGELGRVLVHGVAIKPGKPVLLGVAGGKPLLGIPGYPVSAALSAELFLRPLICRWLGCGETPRPLLEARLSRPVASNMGVLEFLRVKVGRVQGRLVAVPMPRGAGVITSLVRADGIVRIPRGTESLPEGSTVEVELLRPAEEIATTVLAVGSHDLLLDMLSSGLARRWPGTTLSSAHVGSQGGLVALRRGEAHLAGVHLLDPATGEYNVAYVRQHLRGRKVALFTLAFREQGLLVRRGNPRGLHDFAGLAREGVRYVNRQAGSGTRVLLDFHLARLGVDPAAIAGYRQEVFTHTAVAAAVAAGSADCGLGISAVAKSFGLDFVALARERYELAIPAENLDLPGMERLLELARSPAWRREVAALGGYDLSETGRMVWVLEDGGSTTDA